MSELPGAKLPEPTSHPLLVHEEPSWKPALIVTAFLDLIALASLYYAYSLGTVEELAMGTSEPKQWVMRVLLGAVFTQIGAIPVARRTRLPWVIPAWAALFVISAGFLAVTALAGAMSIPSTIQ